MIVSSPLSILLLLFPNLSIATKLRTTYLVPRSGEECLVETLHQKEHVTFSVTITSGDELTAVASIEGPIAPESAKETKEIEDYYTKYRQGKRFGGEVLTIVERGRGYDGKGNLRFTDYLDHEHRIDYRGYDDDITDDDDYGHRMTHGGRNRDKYKRGGMQGDEWQQTFEIKTAGWYRACVKARKSEVYVEMELRKSSELGLDDEKNHVLTWAHYERLLHEHHIDEDAAKEDDLNLAKAKLKDLNRVIYKIKDIQRDEQRRLEVHKSINEHSRKRMALGSLLETGIFMVVSFVQVMTIRRWFKNPILCM